MNKVTAIRVPGHGKYEIVEVERPLFGDTKELRIHHAEHLPHWRRGGSEKGWLTFEASRYKDGSVHFDIKEHATTTYKRVMFTLPAEVVAALVGFAKDGVPFAAPALPVEIKTAE